MYSRCDPGMGQSSMGWAPFCQAFEKFVNIPHSILTSLVMCGLRGADSTKLLQRHFENIKWDPTGKLNGNITSNNGRAPKTEGADHLCLSHTHRSQGWILQLIQKFLHMEKLPSSWTSKAEEWEDGSHKQWEHRKAVWYGRNSLEPRQHLLLSATEGCSVEASLRGGIRMNHLRSHFLYVGKSPFSIHITHNCFYTIFTDPVCNTNWLVAFLPIILLVSKRYFTYPPNLSIPELFTDFLHWFSWDRSIVMQVPHIFLLKNRLFSFSSYFHMGT